MPPVVPKKIADEHSRQIHARNRGGPAGAHDTHRGGTPFAVDENPVEEGVDDIGADESESDGLAMFMACRQRRTAKYRRRGKSPKASASMYGTARAATCGSMCNRRRSGLKNQTAVIRKGVMTMLR